MCFGISNKMCCEFGDFGFILSVADLDDFGLELFVMFCGF